MYTSKRASCSQFTLKCHPTFPNRALNSVVHPEPVGCRREAALRVLSSEIIFAIVIMQLQHVENQRYALLRTSLLLCGDSNCFCRLRFEDFVEGRSMLPMVDALSGTGTTRGTPDDVTAWGCCEAMLGSLGWRWDVVTPQSFGAVARGVLQSFRCKLCASDDVTCSCATKSRDGTFS